MKPAILLSFAGSLLCVTAPVFAEDGVIRTYEKEATVYEFEDDALAALGGVPVGARLVVRKGFPRTTLLRPRTHFVRELVKSAEHF